MGLDSAEFVVWAEQEFEIDIPEADAVDILIVGAFTAYVHGKLLDVQGSDALSEEAIFQKVKIFLISSFDVPADKITRESFFIKDLKLDQ